MARMISGGFSNTETGCNISMAPGLNENSYLNSLEQFITPVRIDKGHNGSATPCFRQPGPLGEGGNFGDGKSVGPTVHELDPYFPKIFSGDDGSGFFSDCDYRVVGHAGAGNTPYDANLRKFEDKGGDRSSVPHVQVMSALRGPLIMSGWGFGMDDLPQPSSGSSYPSNTQFSANLKDDRGHWKTGPVHLMWDDERQVWAGGHRFVCGVAKTEIKAPADVCTPETFTVQVFRNIEHKGSGKLSTVLCEFITVYNRDPSLEQECVKDAVFVIAMKLNYEWVPVWVGCPEEPCEHCPCVTDCPEVQKGTDC